jgi:hypothetical protein
MRVFELVLPAALLSGTFPRVTLETADDLTVLLVHEEVQANGPGTRIGLAYRGGAPPRYYRLRVAYAGVSRVTPAYRFPRDAP